MDFNNTHWHRVPSEFKVALSIAIEDKNKLWLAAMFGKWELQAIGCTTCPEEVERIWHLWKEWEQYESTDQALDRLINGHEELTRSRLEMMFFQNIVQPAFKKKKLSLPVEDKDLEKMLLVSLYRCNTEAGLKKPMIVRLLSTAFQKPERTLHRWFSDVDLPEPTL